MGKETAASSGHAFRVAIERLRESLEHAASNNASDRYIALQNATIRALVDYYNSAEARIKELVEENHRLALQILEERTNHRQHQELLEGICLLHGIYDLQSWLKSGHGFAVDEAVHFARNSLVQLPYAFREMIDVLDDTEKETLFELLNQAKNRLRGTVTLTIKNDKI